MVKKLKWNLVLMSALYLGLGVFLLMKPTTALNIVCYALGAVVLACAAVQLIRYFVVERGILCFGIKAGAPAVILQFLGYQSTMMKF